MKLTSTIACGRTCLCNSASESTALDARGRCPVSHEFGSAGKDTARPATPVSERRAVYHAELQAARARQGPDVPYKLQQLGVPFDAIASSRNPMHNESISAATRFRNEDRELCRVLLLSGDYGVGKTTAAAWLLGKAVENFEWNDAPSGGKAAAPFVWAHASEVTSETDFGRVDPGWLDGLKRCRLLVLDDLGKDATATGHTALRDVLVERMNGRRATVITTNLAPSGTEKKPGLREVYGESWFDRLKSYALVPDLRESKKLRKDRSRPTQTPNHRSAE